MLTKTSIDFYQKVNRFIAMKGKCDYNEDMNMGSYDNGIAEWTDTILKKHGGLTLRQAEQRTGGQVTYSTISNMLAGRRVGETIVIKFASAFKENVANALRVFGYNEMAELWESGGQDGAQPDRLTDTRAEYHAEDIPPELQNVYGLHGKVINALPPGKARDRYIQGLRERAETDWALVRERLNEDEGQE